MEELKVLFDNGALTYEQFEEELAKHDDKVKLANLRTGAYITKEKSEAAVATAKSLAETYKTRLDDVSAKVTAFEAMDVEAIKASVASITADRDALTKQIADMEYKSKLDTIVSTEEFSCASAKKAFVADLVAQDFKFDGTTLLGYADFLKAYKETDPGTFATEQANLPFVFGANKGAPAAMTKADYLKLGTADRIKLKNEQPELYRQLVG